MNVRQEKKLQEMWALYTFSILNLTFVGCRQLHFPTTAVLNYFLIICVEVNTCLSLHTYMTLCSLLIYKYIRVFLCFKFAGHLERSELMKPIETPRSELK